MVLKFKSKSCKVELGSEYSVDQFKDDVCSVTFAKCWEKEIYGGEIFDYYDFMCACKTFDSRKALELLKEVIVKNKPEYAIVTIAPFDHPAGPLYSYLYIIFKSLKFSNIYLKLYDATSPSFNKEEIGARLLAKIVATYILY